MITELWDTYPEARLTAEAIFRGLTNFRLSKFPDDKAIDSGYENEVCTLYTFAPPSGSTQLSLLLYTVVCLIACVCKSDSKSNNYVEFR